MKYTSTMNPNEIQELYNLRIELDEYGKSNYSYRGYCKVQGSSEHYETSKLIDGRILEEHIQYPVGFKVCFIWESEQAFREHELTPIDDHKFC